MVFFPNEQLELFEYVETGELDSYLEPKKEYKLKCTVPCDFQAMTPNDDLREFGEIMDDSYKIYIDHNVPVDSGMILRLQGKNDTYEITGTVMDNNHLPVVNHIKLVVKKQRKPTPVVIPEPETTTTSNNNDGDVEP